MPDIICAGFGGQGVLTAGLILAKTGMDLGYNVTWIPSYGSEMRGGTANCNLKISDGKIASPFVRRIDILLAMNTPSVEKFMPMMRPGSLLVVNTSLVNDCAWRSDIAVAEVEATLIAEQEENLRGANVSMLGALAATRKLFDRDTTSRGIEAFFESKGKNNPKNMACFEKGFTGASVTKDGCMA
ncbi:MAG: 2-oxoacid:acceptor oxidoreductase family protein [Synergistaceae bacterium]|jgi:2-oxoglutarate ferredoxin oxidoreductase subunit gamma|nr:2-oxoacid:acceptor oxidoreductase family protein [Synergistaceae bacterium]